MLKDCKINILGEQWRIEFHDAEENPRLIDSCGYADSSVRLIVIDDMSHIDLHSKEDLYAHKQEVLRHEIIHAFLLESGIGHNSHKSENWGIDEEIVDWFAIQSPKIMAAFREAGCI